MNQIQDVNNSEALVAQILASINSVVLDKEQSVKMALTCLLARGHLLLEDLPGMGKTTLAHALAQTLGLEYARVQFTSDLLPADLLGLSVFNRQSSQFDFHPGPVFNQVLLADEINRATPKTQSALLEAMEERQVSIEGETRALPAPFFVIATQNPVDQSGTFELPESQLDRFALRLSLGYPSERAELRLLQGMDSRQKLSQMNAVTDAAGVTLLQRGAQAVAAGEALLAYVQRLIAASRNSADILHGLSPRAAMILVAAAKAWAFIEQRNFVLPEDVQQVFSAVVAHRLRGRSASSDGQLLAQQLLDEVDVL
ncbi:MAG: AAA family ATPase [Pseudomonadales bacterium]